METWTLLPVVLVAVSMVVGATHQPDCTITSADPSTINVIDLTPLGGPLWYFEERGNPLGTSPPVPWSGFLIGDGTFWYEEANGIDGLQRGTSCLQDEPDCQFDGYCYPNNQVCLIIVSDGLIDRTCGHGRDQLKL